VSSFNDEVYGTTVDGAVSSDYGAQIPNHDDSSADNIYINRKKWLRQQENYLLRQLTHGEISEMCS
jgi:hypothetical protein